MPCSLAISILKATVLLFIHVSLPQSSRFLLLATAHLDWCSLEALIQQKLKDRLNEETQNNDYSIKDLSLYMITKFQIQGYTEKMFCLFVLYTSSVLCFLFDCQITVLCSKIKF